MVKQYLRISGLLLIFTFFFFFGFTHLEAKAESDHLSGQADLCLKEKERAFTNKPYLILCFGDDFTYDSHNLDKGSYPYQLEKMLNEKSKAKFIVYNFGRMMSDSLAMLDLIKKNINEFHPDYLTLMIGADDKLPSVLDGRAGIDAESVLKLRAEFAKLNYGPQSKNISMHSREGFFDRRQTLLTKKVRDLKKMLEQNPNNDEVKEALATKYIEEKKYKLAIQQLEAIIKLNPDDIWVHEKLGTLYETLGNHTLSQKHFKEGVRIDPWNRHCHLNLGIACWGLGQRELGNKHLAIANKIKKMCLDSFEQNLISVFNLAKDSNCKLILLKYHWPDEEIDPIIDKVGKEHAILIVDSYQPKFQEVRQSKKAADYFFADGFLTAASNFVIAQAVCEKIKENLDGSF